MLVAILGLIGSGSVRDYVQKSYLPGPTQPRLLPPHCFGRSCIIKHCIRSSSSTIYQEYKKNSASHKSMMIASTCAKSVQDVSYFVDQQAADLSAP